MAVDHTDLSAESSHPRFFCILFLYCCDSGHKKHASKHTAPSDGCFSCPSEKPFARSGSEKGETRVEMTRRRAERGRMAGRPSGAVLLHYVPSAVLGKGGQDYDSGPFNLLEPPRLLLQITSGGDRKQDLAAWNPATTRETGDGGKDAGSEEAAATASGT